MWLRLRCSILLIAIALSSAYFVHNSVHFNSKLAMTDIAEPTFERWSNPKYSEDKMNAWFLELEKPLLTVGSKGISNSQINSIAEMMRSHERYDHVTIHFVSFFSIRCEQGYELKFRLTRSVRPQLQTKLFKMPHYRQMLSCFR